MTPNPFPPPYYSIQRNVRRSVANRISTAGSGNTPPQTGVAVLVAIGRTRSGIMLRVKPRPLNA